MVNETSKQYSNTGSARAIGIVSGLLVVVLAVVLVLTIQNDNGQQAILKDSIEQQLIATSIAARDMVDPDLVEAIDSPADIVAHQAAYDQTMQNLRKLRDDVGATYIYVLKQIDGEVYFIFDTDEEEADILGDPYELSRVHEQAFLGEIGADTLNVVDEWGSFNTGAAPIYLDDSVVGIISTDVEDTFLQKSIEATGLNILILIVTLVLILGVLLAVIITLLRRVSRMQQKLYRSANFDSITSLPNRNYLFNLLRNNNRDAELSKVPYAMMFVDLDNFKSVNDGAGHDIGDVLLRQIAAFLQKSAQATRSLYPDIDLQALAARIGGDEFLLVLPGIASQEQAAEFATELLRDFAKTAELQKFINEFGVGLSIGLTIYPTDSNDYNELIKFADVSMYHAKAAGKNQFAIYTPEMSTDAETLELTVRSSRGSE